MTDRKWFTPAPGMTIPDPHTRAICPPEGMWVAADDAYWIRRSIDGGGALSDGPPLADEPST